MSLWLNPDNVTFAGAPLTSVRSVRLQRFGETAADKEGTARKWRQFTDVLRRETVVTLEREVAGPLSFLPETGTEGVLRFESALGRSDGGRSEFTMTGVVTSQSVTLDRQKQAVQTLTITGVSSDGMADPVTIREIR